MRGKNVNAKHVSSRKEKVHTRIPNVIGIKRVSARKKSHRG